jgi:hypothetical protein
LAASRKFSKMFAEADTVFGGRAVTFFDKKKISENLSEKKFMQNLHCS